MAETFWFLMLFSCSCMNINQPTTTTLWGYERGIVFAKILGLLYPFCFLLYVQPADEHRSHGLDICRLYQKP